MPLCRTKEQANNGASQAFRLYSGTGSPGHNLCLALGGAEADGKQSDAHVNPLRGRGDPADFSAEYKGLRPPTPGPVTSREQGLLDTGDQTSQEYLQEALKERKRQHQCHCHKGCLRGSVQEFFSCGVSSWSPKFAFSWPTFTHLISSPFISPLYFLSLDEKSRGLGPRCSWAVALTSSPYLSCPP